MDIQNILETQGKENLDLANRMRNYQDPLLAAFDEEQSSKKSKTTADDSESGDTDGASSSSESSDDEEAEVTIKFPKNNAQDLLQFISRDLTNIQNHDEPQKRKFALLRLYQIFVLAKDKAPNKIYQELLPEL
jgi:hypothetical protein